MNIIKLSPADQRQLYTGDCEICGPVKTYLAIVHREMIIRGQRFMVYAKLCPAHFIKPKDAFFITGKLTDEAQKIVNAVKGIPEFIDIMLDLNLNKESLDRLKIAMKNFAEAYEADGTLNLDEIENVLETTEQR